MKRRIVTPPVLPPAALAELKDWLGITTAADDAPLGAALAAALELCEDFTGRMPLQAECEETLCVTGGWQVLATRPVQAIASVEGVPADGARFALNLADYEIDLDADGGGLVRILAPGLARFVAVRFTAGIAADWAECRRACATGSSASPRTSTGAARTISPGPYRRRRSPRCGGPGGGCGSHDRGQGAAAGPAAAADRPRGDSGGGRGRAPAGPSLVAQAAPALAPVHERIAHGSAFARRAARLARRRPAAPAELNAVVEEAPARTALPWLALAASASADWSTKTAPGREIRVALELHCRGDRSDDAGALVTAIERRVEALPAGQGEFEIASIQFLRARAEQRAGNTRAVLLEYRFRLIGQ